MWRWRWEVEVRAANPVCAFAWEEHGRRRVDERIFEWRRVIWHREDILFISFFLFFGGTPKGAVGVFRDGFTWRSTRGRGAPEKRSRWWRRSSRIRVSLVAGMGSVRGSVCVRVGERGTLLSLCKKSDVFRHHHFVGRLRSTSPTFVASSYIITRVPVLVLFELLVCKEYE